MRLLSKGTLLALAVIVAALAMTAAPASATITVSNKTSTLSTTSSLANRYSLINTGSTTFTVSGANVSCSHFTVTAAIPVPATSSVSTTGAGVAITSCTATVNAIGQSGAATLTVTGADAWTITITKALGGGSFQVSITFGAITMQSLGCSIQLAKGQTISGIWTNATHSLTVTAGVAFTATGVGCLLPASGTAQFAASFSELTVLML